MKKLLLFRVTKILSPLIHWLLTFLNSLPKERKLISHVLYSLAAPPVFLQYIARDMYYDSTAISLGTL